ncbi:MAG: hypothetical protein ACTSUF_09700 [Candidatus Heimdallarchaeaceae archaeon]
MISLEGLIELAKMKKKGKPLPKGYKEEVLEYVTTKKKYHWGNVKKKHVLDMCSFLGVDIDEKEE